MPTGDGYRLLTSSWIPDRIPRLWTLWAASRPSQLALVVLVYVLGVGMATAGAPVTSTGSAAPEVTSRAFLESVLVGGTALLSVAVAIHYANEYADYETDALTNPTPFSGGSGALVRTGLPRSFVRSATVAATVLASVVVGAVALTGGLPSDALAILVTIFAFGLAYSLQPIAFVRRGVGEVVNAVLGGLLLPLYGVAVVASPRPAAALAVVPFTLVVVCNLFATHWPDRKADAAVGKRTLAVRWSPRRLRRAYAVVAVAAGISVVALWLADVVPDVVVLAHFTPLPFLVWGGVVLTKQRSPLPAVLAMVVLALTATVGWWWAGIGPS